MHGTRILEEADRLMTVCNSCRYCEGLCAVFPAMEMRRSFSDGDLNYLANLCHACGACYTDCQFSPPHEFNVNVPKTLAVARVESWSAYAWPGSFSGLFARNGLAVSIIAALSVTAFIFGFAAFTDHQVLVGVHTGPGAFYALMPHKAMAALFGVAFLYAVVALGLSLRAFWHDIGEPIGMAVEAGSLWQAMKDAGRLRYLDGGGVGLLIGPAGLLAEKLKRDPAMVDETQSGMDVAFIVMLFLTSLTGLALLVWRDTAAMGPLLAFHLGVVFALFITLPYGKFVHGLYRYVALVRYARERRMMAQAVMTE